MARIPIYNLQTQISGQAGSTDVIQIPQSATSGAIANIADTTSKALSDIAKFGNVIIENESKRIIAQEQISYKTQLDTAQKNVMLANPNQPEIWMDEYEKVKVSLLNDIQSKDYKYDFVRKSVTNNINIDYLPLRNGLFNKFLEKTKTLNLITFEEGAMFNSNALGAAVTLNVEDFEATMFTLTENLANYATYGGAANSTKLFTDAYKNAFRIGLETVFKGNTNIYKSTLTLEMIDQLDDETMPGVSNLKTLIGMLNDNDARAVLEKFTDNEFEAFKLEDRINTEVLEKQKNKKDELLYTLYTSNDSQERSGAYSQLNKLPFSVFDDGEKNEYMQWYNSSITETGFQPSSNPLGNASLTAKLKSQINEYNVTFMQLQGFMKDLNPSQQSEVMAEWNGKRKELKGDFRKKVLSEFGSDGNNIIIIGAEDDDASEIISLVTSLAIDKFNDLVTTNPNANFSVEVPKIIKEAKEEFKGTIRLEVEKIIFQNLQMLEGATPENVTQLFQQKYKQLMKDGNKEEAFKLQFEYNKYGDIIRIYDSYN
tara:strand:- start:1083 stop:2705 length:1623 start_codon:yes stop_codon:yes gene_type:complete